MVDFGSFDELLRVAVQIVTNKNRSAIAHKVMTRGRSTGVCFWLTIILKFINSFQEHFVLPGCE